MESSDVIELNSSDDEARAPAPKTMKHLSNAMVHIPNKLYDTTITPTRNKHKGVGKSSITKIQNSTNVNIQSPQNNKSNGKHLLRNTSRLNEKKYINPLHVANIPIRVPRNITIKRTKGPDICKEDVIPSCEDFVSKKKRKDLDTVPAVTHVPGPQWYLPPEEQLKKESLEVANNKEPELSNMIEITIDDSPIKPLDQPISGNAAYNENDTTKTLHLSKKKLDYPETNINDIEETETASDIIFEIESNKVEGNLENKEVESQANARNVSNETTASNTLKPDNDVAKDKTELDDQQTLRNKTAQDQTEKNTSEIVGEFHPIYQKFIDLCFELDNTDDMKKIVDKKIKLYYKQVPKDYVESKKFLDMVSVKVSLIKANPDKIFLYIKDIVDELRVQKKIMKSQEMEIKNGTETEAITDIVDDSERESRRRSQIRKLDKTIKKLHRAVQKLEAQEVDLYDEDNSVYLLTARYTKRLVQLHAKLCQVTKIKMPYEPQIRIESRPGRPPGPAKKLEKWINKKVPLGNSLPFPDFHNVVACVKEANDEEKLGWNETEIMEEARDLFTRCGLKLQRKRQENEFRLVNLFLPEEADQADLADPADSNIALKMKFDENRRVGERNVADIVNRFADRQKELKLEGVEIGDKEAEESPDDSEDEDINVDSNSLDDKTKRKDRLRRLLEEKSKKSTESHKESECSSQNKDSTENVSKITDEEKSTENNTRTIDTMNTSKEQMPTCSKQQISTCLDQSDTEAAKMQNKIVSVSDTKQTSYVGISDHDNKTKTSSVLTSLIQHQTEKAEIRKSTDNDKIASQRTCSPNRTDDITEDNISATRILASSLQGTSEMQVDNLSLEAIGDPEENITEGINKYNLPNMLTDTVQNGAKDTENYNKDDIATKNICESDKKDVAEGINIPLLLSSVQNKIENAKLQISMDKDNLATEVDSDTKNEGIEARFKFKYEEHINLVDYDSDVDELNLLQKRHSGDDQSSSSDSEMKDSSDESFIAISDTLETDDENDVISIENSSNSESESIGDDNVNYKKYMTGTKRNAVTYDLEEESQEEIALDADKDDKNCEIVNEDILLAPSEDEDEDCGTKDIALSKFCGNYVNLKDDDISISETQLQKVAPTNYNTGELGDCEISQTINNEFDEN